MGIDPESRLARRNCGVKIFLDSADLGAVMGALPPFLTTEAQRARRSRPTPRTRGRPRQLLRFVGRKTWSATRERTFTSRNQYAFVLGNGDCT